MSTPGSPYWLQANAQRQTWYGNVSSIGFSHFIVNRLWSFVYGEKWYRSLVICSKPFCGHCYLRHSVPGSQSPAYQYSHYFDFQWDLHLGEFVTRWSSQTVECVAALACGWMCWTERRRHTSWNHSTTFCSQDNLLLTVVVVESEGETFSWQGMCKQISGPDPSPSWRSLAWVPGNILGSNSGRHDNWSHHPSTTKSSVKIWS